MFLHRKNMQILTKFTFIFTNMYQFSTIFHQEVEFFTNNVSIMCLQFLFSLQFFSRSTDCGVCDKYPACMGQAGWWGDVTSGLPTGWEEVVGGMGKVWSQSASAVHDGSNKGPSPPCRLSSPLLRRDDSSCSAEVASSSNLAARLSFHATALCSC